MIGLVKIGYRGRLIVYCLGNLVFDDFDGRAGRALRLTLDKGGLVDWDTLVVRTDARGIPRLDRGAASPAGRARWTGAVEVPVGPVFEA
jgi:hypothetical protein